MSAIASKNLYELLGNDLEHDPDRPADPPVKVADKPAPRAGKRNATEAPAPRADPLRPSENARGGRDQGNRGQRDDGARGDRRTREPREYRGDGPRGGRGRGRGGRGGRGGAPRDDRHSHTGIGEHEKQAAAGWGAEADGQAEWNDEKAGDAIASAEAKNSEGFTPDTGAADPAFSNGPDRETGADDVAPEPEDNTKSYDQYLAEQAEKRLALSGNSLEVRKPNEGSKQKFPNGTAFTRVQEDFFAASGGKTKREKEVKSKVFVPLEDRIYSAPDSGERGRGGGRGRGGRGRGEGRGDFRGEGRGDFRGDRRGGGRGRGEGGFSRGAPRGGQAPRGGPSINAQDESAFPALGA